MLRMIQRACGDEIDANEFRSLRTELISASQVSSRVPPCVRACRDPGSVWSYVKARGDLPTYESRRQHFRSEFEPLLAYLEQSFTTPLEEVVVDAGDRLDAEAVSSLWRRSLDRCGDDPEGAITLARSLLETVCKTILEDLGEQPGAKDDLPALYSKAASKLNLGPSQHSEESIKRILGGAMAAVNGLGSLRNQIGDSHGQGRRSYKAEPRHAMFAVNLAGSMAVFLSQTAQIRAGSAQTEVPRLRVGDKVRHRTFGEGAVVAVEPGRVVQIRFSDGSVRRIMYDYAPIEVES